ncbi:MAG TPA: hypothetical protein VE997_07880, partial [Candidatus Limnocylindria bacterium]|nr:hypothetical protein [Candidatus Limnocylindria bacterium]
LRRPSRRETLAPLRRPPFRANHRRMLGGRPPRRPRAPEGYGSLEASLLHCPRCRQAMPVRKRLLLVLLDGEKHEYVCQRCGTPCASKIEPPPRVLG